MRLVRFRYGERVATGAIIMTGTPEGVGKLAPGDAVEVEMEGMGVLRNEVAP